MNEIETKDTEALEDKNLKDVAGGYSVGSVKCPVCGESDKIIKKMIGHSQLVRLYCTRCGNYVK